MVEKIIGSINRFEAIIGIIGLGYVGLPLLLRFGEVGFNVLGFDVDSQKINCLLKGKSYIKHVPSSKIKTLLDGKMADFSHDFGRLSEADCLLICVPTPLTPHRQPDMRYVFNTAEQIGRALRKGQLVVLESTTYPGATEEHLLPILEKYGFKVGKDFFLAYSPEREDPGNPHYHTGNIPKLVSGVTERCLAVSRALYEKITERVVTVSSPKVAEFAKLLENIYRSVNIALVNEMKVLAQRMGIDIWEVIDAASTKPFGFTPFYPGPGLGGHCIPIDPFYLVWKAREYDFTARFIELAGEVNVSMPRYVVDRLVKALNDRGKCLKGSSVLVLGIAYKKDVDDDRESPAYPIIDMLMEGGAKVSYHDPHILELRPTRKYDFTMKSIRLDEKTISSFDAVIIVTDHSFYDFGFIVRHAKLVVDTRNATKGLSDPYGKIVKA